MHNYYYLKKQLSRLHTGHYFILNKKNTDAALKKLAPFNPSGLYKTDAQTLSYLGNRNSDWWRECEEGGWYEGKPLRSDKMTAPKMSICQWEMKRSPVGICYRQQWQPVWKISSKSFSMALLIHEINFFLFPVRDVRGASPLNKAILTKGGTYGTGCTACSRCQKDRSPSLCSIPCLHSQRTDNVTVTLNVHTGRHKGKEGRRQQDGGDDDRRWGMREN